MTDWQISNSEVSETSLDLSRWPQVRVQKLVTCNHGSGLGLLGLFRCIIPRDALVSDNLLAFGLRFTWQTSAWASAKLERTKQLCPLRFHRGARTLILFRL